MDNMTAVHVLRNDTPKTVALDKWNAQVRTLAKATNLVIHPYWIPSQRNTVDGLSRGHKITNEELRITKLIAEEWLGGVGGARAPVKNIYIRNDELKHSEEFPFLAWLTD